MKTITYKGKVKLGYLGDYGHEWWTEEDWKAHNKRVEELKASGDYGKEVEIDLTIVPNPAFDESHETITSPPLSSWRMQFLDFGKNG